MSTKTMEEKKRRGRPSRGEAKPHRVPVYMTSALYDKVWDFALFKGQSLTEYITRALTKQVLEDEKNGVKKPFTLEE